MSYDAHRFSPDLAPHIKLLWKITNRTARRYSVPPDDLFGEVCVAAIRLLKRYDPSRGVVYAYLDRYAGLKAIRAYYQGHGNYEIKLEGGNRRWVHKQVLIPTDPTVIGRSRHANDPETEPYDADTVEAMYLAIRDLPPRLREVARIYLATGQYSDIAAKYGVSYTRARHLVGNVVKRLRGVLCPTKPKRSATASTTPSPAFLRAA